jgi:hypothetical protein
MYQRVRKLLCRKIKIVVVHLTPKASSNRIEITQRKEINKTTELEHVINIDLFCLTIPLKWV